MIEKLFSSDLTRNLAQRAAVPSSLSDTSSPFQTILNQEKNPSTSLEKMLLDFLIKTIESIMAKTDQTDTGSSFFSLPFFGGVSFQPQAFLNNRLSESSLGVSVGKFFKWGRATGTI